MLYKENHYVLIKSLQYKYNEYKNNYNIFFSVLNYLFKRNTLNTDFLTEEKEFKHKKKYPQNSLTLTEFIRNLIK